MKYLLIVLLMALLPSCSMDKNTSFSYSGIFKISYPQSLLSGSTVFSADGLTLKTREGKSVSGLIISSQSDNLPTDFDMRSYPEIILGMKEYLGSDTAIREKFANSKRVFNETYDLSDLAVQNREGVTRYGACKENSCLGFVVKNSFSEHVLIIYSEGFDKVTFLKMLNGSVSVK
ncbi:MAG TPA: hypothetical protein VN030_03540 [Cellvibrio sp.]|nr:hypothetical protein [Cellvibrio sp.]